MSLFVIDKIERLSRAGLNAEQIQRQLEFPYSILEIEQFIPLYLRPTTPERKPYRKRSRVNVQKTARFARQRGFKTIVI